MLISLLFYARLVTFFISIAWLCFYNTSTRTRVALGVVVAITSILVALTLHNGNWTSPTRSELVSKKLAVAASHIKKNTKCVRKSLRTMSLSLKTVLTPPASVKRKSNFSEKNLDFDEKCDLEADLPSSNAKTSMTRLRRLTSSR